MAIMEYLSDRRILMLMGIVLILFALDLQYGGPHFLHFGIEFIGGTQIPITLEHTVTPDQMASILNTLQQRVSTFGLKEITVEGVGNSQIYVTIPSVSGAEINQTIGIIESQGIFQGVVNGREAINGSSILSGSIGAAQPIVSGGNVSWAVNFFIVQQAADRFAKVVYGQANQPLYMFLDRPTHAIILVNSSIISQVAGTSGTDAAISAMQQAVALGNASIPVELLSPDASNWPALRQFFAAKSGLYNKVILAANSPGNITQDLLSMNYTLSFQSLTNMTPQFTSIASGVSGQQAIVEGWQAVGLLSSPVLSPGITNGTAGQSYQISGAAPTTLPVSQRLAFATNQSKTISSVLSGGALPVHVIVGVPKTIQPTLGDQAMRVSWIIALLSMGSVALIMILRYKKPFLVIPIMLTTLTELFIIVSIIGLVGTIDLAAVAGMIAVVGTGVDAQIIITDQVLSGKTEHGVRQHLGNAFYVVYVSATLLVIAMLPLLFATSLVSIIGFAESTILGALLGVAVTRPAYGAIVSKHFKGASGA